VRSALFRQPRLFLHLLATVGLVLLVAACDDDGAPPEEAVASPAATEPPTPVPTLPPALVSIGSLNELDSFRYSVRLSLSIPQMEDELLQGFASLLSEVEIRGASIPPDKSEMWIEFKNSGHALGTLIIGDNTWFNSAEEWTETPNSGLDASLLTPEKISGALAQEEMFAGVRPLREELDGVPALHYTVTQQGMRWLALLLNTEEESGITGETKVDLWLTEEGHYPIRITFDAHGKDEQGRDVLVTLEMQVTNLNDPLIEIVPPPA